MAEDITYEYLWRICIEEKKTNKLLPLAKDFYNNTEKLLDSFRSSEHDERTKNIKNNTAKILRELYERRRQKILIYAAYGRQLPPQTPENEKELYEKICEISKGAIEEKTIKSENQSFLKSLKDMPEIILPSGRKIGPLTKDQELNVKDKDDISFLINSEICEKL